MPSRIGTALVLLAIGSGLFFAGCERSTPKAKGQLMLSVSTNMEVPKDFDAIQIEVSASGRTLHSSDYAVGESDLRLPATLAILEGTDPASTVKIRIFALKHGRVRFLREVVTTVPADRIATLRVNIEWLCFDWVEGDSVEEAESTCGSDETCVGGRCVAQKVALKSLETYAPEAVFGGASEPGEGGDCFDTGACFEQGSLSVLTYEDVGTEDASCSAPLEGEVDEVNVGIVTAPEGPGVCGAESCIVVLDHGSEGGWQESDDRIVLPVAVCQKVASGEAVGVATTTACSTKTVGVPTCGAWSSVGNEGATDSHAPEGVVELLAAGGAGGGGEDNVAGMGDSRDAGGGGNVTAGAHSGGRAAGGTAGRGEGGAGRGGQAAGGAALGGEAGQAGAGGSSIAEGLVAYWNVDEGDPSQQWLDASGHELHLTRGATDAEDASDPTYFWGARGGYSGYLDGIDDYSWRPNSDALAPRQLTVGAWLRLDSLELVKGRAWDLFGNRAATCEGGGYLLSLESDQGTPALTFSFRDSDPCSLHSVSLPLADLDWQPFNWYHVAATYEDSGERGSIVRLFVDAEPEVETAVDARVDFTDVPRWFVGTSGDGLGGSGEQERELRGYIDEVFLYDRVLTQEEIGIWAERSPPSDLLGEYYWNPWTNGETLPYWVTEPSADEIHLFAESEAQSNSGVNMDFGSPLKTLDLSGYDELVFDAEVAEGTPFVVAVSLDMVVGSWCSWNLVGRGLATYQVPLGSPDYCTTCTFDLRFVSGLDFSTDWRTAASLDLRLTRISFETTTGGAGTARPDELTPGVLDLCWGLYAWGEGDEPASSQWTQAPDATQVSVQATGSESGEAGMLSRLEPDPTDLTPYGYIEFEATVTQGVPFRVSLGTAAAERCAYELDGRGADTYLVDRTQPSGCWDETGTEITDFDFRQVNTIDFGTVWGTVGVVDISVTGFRFLSSDSSL